MKKVISILVALGFVWMLAVPSLVGQEKKSESRLNDVKDPKEAWAMVVGSWNSAVVLFSGYTDDLYEYEKNGKLDIWKTEERFKEADQDILWLWLSAIYGHLSTANDLLFEGKAELLLGSLEDLIAINGPLHKNFKGTVEDVRKAEKAIFSAINLLNTVHKSSVLKLIKKDQEQKEKK